MKKETGESLSQDTTHKGRDIKVPFNAKLDELKDIELKEKMNDELSQAHKDFQEFKDLTEDNLDSND